MKKLLAILTLTIGMTLGVIAEEQKNPLEGWDLNLGFMFSSLDDTTVASGIDTHDAFENDANGFDIYGSYELNDRATALVGYNFIQFDGDTYSTSGLNLDVDDLDVSALYTGVKLKAYEYEDFKLFGRLELGFAFTEDVDYKLSAAPGFVLLVDANQKGFDGETDLYYSYGIGIEKDLGERFNLSLGYQFRSYGEMDGYATSAIPTSDFDVETSGFDLGVSYRF